MLGNKFRKTLLFNTSENMLEHFQKNITKNNSFFKEIIHNKIVTFDFISNLNKNHNKVKPQNIYYKLYFKKFNLNYGFGL